MLEEQSQKSRPSLRRLTSEQSNDSTYLILIFHLRPIQNLSADPPLASSESLARIRKRLELSSLPIWRNLDEMLEKFLGRVEELLPRVPENELIELLRASAHRLDELLYSPNRDAHIRKWGKHLEDHSIPSFVTSSIRQSKLSLLVLKKWWA